MRTGEPARGRRRCRPPTAAAPRPRPPPRPPALAGAGRADAPAPCRHDRAVARIEFPAGADEVLVPMTQMRKGIAAQMTRALQAPHAYVQMEVDVDPPRRLPRDAPSGLPGEGGDRRSATCRSSSRRRPRRSSATRRSTPTGPTTGLLAKRRVNIGVAVAVDDGLIVPVIRDADQLSIHGLNVAIADVAAPGQGEQAQRRRLRRRDVHRRQHRLSRHEPRHADPQRARGRDRHDGGDHEAPGRRRRRRTATSSRSGR